MPRWKIREDREDADDDEGSDDSVALTVVVTAPNGMSFESFHPRVVVEAIVASLEKKGVLAVGDDPVLPSDWPELVLIPAAHGPCRRCGDRKSASEYSLKPNGELSGTCDSCCLNDVRRGSKLRICPKCSKDRPDMRMRGGVVGCPACLAVVPASSVQTAPAFDVDKFCRDRRDDASLPQSSAARNAARNVPVRSVVAATKLF